MKVLNKEEMIAANAGKTVYSSYSCPYCGVRRQMVIGFFDSTSYGEFLCDLWMEDHIETEQKIRSRRR